MSRDSLGGSITHSLLAAVIGALVALAGEALLIGPRVARIEAQVDNLQRSTDQLVRIHLHEPRAP